MGIAAVVAVATAGCGATSRRVALPPVSASPQRVVAAWVAAINAHDTETARALMTPAYAKLSDRAPDSWFTNVESMTHLRVNKPFADVSSAGTLQYRYALDMGAEFVLKQHSVLSMPNGRTTWGFIVVRNNRQQPWRIGEEGTG